MREQSRCGEVALKNIKAGQFPNHQLQAQRIFTMFKEHLDGTPSDLFIPLPQNDCK